MVSEDSNGFHAVTRRKIDVIRNPKQILTRLSMRSDVIKFTRGFKQGYHLSRMSGSELPAQFLQARRARYQGLACQR
jgi:hypothetical protein